MDTEISPQPWSVIGLHLGPGFPHSTEESTYYWTQQRYPSRAGCMAEELQSRVKITLYKYGLCSSTPTMIQKRWQTVSKVPLKLHPIDHTWYLLLLIFIEILAFLSLLEHPGPCSAPMGAFRHPPELEVTCRPSEELLQLSLTNYKQFSRVVERWKCPSCTTSIHAPYYPLGDQIRQCQWAF